MAYKALYRSYRPTKFSEVIGQKHVIQTLKNAITEKRTSHAYVFSGLRGIGKTTIARILAKAVNCENTESGEPCNCCANCLSIINNETTDIVELDAASNNGVDEIRNLLEKVNFLPSVLNKKVYIIDEVHMLSTAAFNALLKTLEEPPAYAMFILATTEPHKIPMTILSRCQRFDFKQLTIEELTKELEYICEQEKITISKDALNAIAEAAEGGMRDALSILDQASVYAEKEVTVDDVNSVTGNISNQKLIELVNAFNNDNATDAINILNELLNMGKEVSRFTTCIIQFCRDILLYKSVNDVPNDKYIYTTEEFKNLAENTDNKRLFYYIDVLVDVQNKIRFTNSQKIYLEVGIMKIVNSATEDIDLLGRIQNLEMSIQQGVMPEYTGNYISSPSAEQRLNTLENKMKKLSNEVDRANMLSFEEKINSKVNVLEEVISKVSALPNTIEERITILENRMTDIELLSNDSITQVNTNSIQNVNSDIYNDKINKLEQELKDTSTKNNAILTALIDDVEHLKSESSIDGSSNNDTVVLELLEKVTELENKLDNNQIVNIGSFDNNKIEEIVNNINNLSTNLDQIKTKVDELYQKGFSEISFDQVFDLNNDSNNDNDLTEVVNELLSDFNNLKLEIESIKNKPINNAALEQDFSLYNKDREFNEFVQKITLEINELNQKIDALKLNDNLSVQDINVSLIDSKIKELENLVKTFDQTSLNNSINEIKTNYFVLTQALTYMKEKIDNLPKNNNSSNVDLTFVNDQIKSLENNISAVANELNELKSNLNNNELELVKEQINQIKEKLLILNNGTEKQKPLKQEVNKPVIKQEEVIVENEQEEVVVKVETKEQDLTSKIYDIRIVENILHESRLTECRRIKDQLVAVWSRLEEKVGAELAPVARLLSNGLLVANGKTQLLIIYPNAQLCNYIMDPKNYFDAKQIIKQTFEKEYDFIALPDDTWKEKRLEYYNLHRNGSAYPTLTPINNPKLRIVVVESKPILSEREKVLKKADSDFFGEDE